MVKKKKKIKIRCQDKSEKHSCSLSVTHMPQRKVICSHDPKTKSIKFYSEKPSSHSIPYLLSSYLSVFQSILNFFCIHSDKLIANITLDSPPLHKK